MTKFQRRTKIFERTVKAQYSKKMWLNGLFLFKFDSLKLMN